MKARTCVRDIKHFRAVKVLLALKITVQITIMVNNGLDRHAKATESYFRSIGLQVFLSSSISNSRHWLPPPMDALGKSLPTEKNSLCRRMEITKFHNYQETAPIISKHCVYQQQVLRHYCSPPYESRLISPRCCTSIMTLFFVRGLKETNSVSACAGGLVDNERR